MNPELQRKEWEAHWIAHPDMDSAEAGVFLFRKTLAVNEVPLSFLIHLSADNRYKLYVNGEMVCFGPSRGDLFNWRFESVDIAPYLQAGSNTLCAVVWNYADMRPVAHFSAGTGLIVQGDSEAEQAVNTDASWKVIRDEAWSMHPVPEVNAYYAAGPGEGFDARLHSWRWMEPAMDDRQWADARELDQGRMHESVKGTGRPPLRTLVARQIPKMEYRQQEFSSVRKVQGLKDGEAVLEEGRDLVIPPHQTVSILLDQGHLTTAYPILRFSGGRDSRMTITYAESLYVHDQLSVKGRARWEKGNRNDVDGKFMRGNFDEVVADGGEGRRFEPLWWRTFRYVEIKVVTQEQPLRLHKAESRFTAYPLESLARFSCDRSVFSDIWDVSWLTQRMCAGENFYDCPYYEQLQYAGDTRIQGLVTYYASGDTALWKKSIQSFYDSRLPFGLTQSRYPSYVPQIIPTFSLVWVTMCHDYLRHSGDAEFIRTLLPAVTDVLQWFELRLDESGLPGDLPYWNFVDWARGKGWLIGVPPIDPEGHSAVVALQYVYTLEKAAELYDHFGSSVQAGHCRAVAARVKKAVLDNCWDEGAGLVADTPSKKTFSQHANVLAVLVELLPAEERADLLGRTIKRKDIAQCTYYFRFYMAEALKKIGMADLYTEMLTPWEDMLNLGLSTFAEMPEPTRSDCHAWSASPIYHFLSLVAGIEPASPGFKRVRIRPALGSLRQVEASMPHPAGEIVVSLVKHGSGIAGEVVLPSGVSGVFEYHGMMIELQPGRNVVQALVQ